MSLKSEIDRTNNNKEKTKKVATNIDNKLVELGGEQAINLSDVDDKIKKLFDNYKKQTLFTNLSIGLDGNNSRNVINFPQKLNISPKRILVSIQFFESSYSTGYETKKRQIVVIDSVTSPYISSINPNNFIINSSKIASVNQGTSENSTKNDFWMQICQIIVLN